MKNNCRGFTLLEIIVSVGILAGISLVVVQAFITTTRTNTKTEILKEVKQNGDYAIEIMSRMIRNARNIVSSPCSAGGDASGDITITNRDSRTTTFRCVVDAGNGVIRIASSSGTTDEFLTNNTVTLFDNVAQAPGCNINALQFTCLAVAGVPSSIKIEFTLAQKGTSPDQVDKAKISFQTSAQLRR